MNESSHGSGSASILFDERSGVLSRTHKVHLEPKASRVLAILLHSQGRLVTREEFRDTIWDGHINDDYAPLHAQINNVREALQKFGYAKSDVENLKSRGYRLSEAVRIEIVRGPSTHPQRPGWPWFLVGILMLIGTSVAVTMLVRRARVDEPTGIPASAPSSSRSDAVTGVTAVEPSQDGPWIVVEDGERRIVTVEPRNGAFLNRFESHSGAFDADPDVETMVVSVDATSKNETTGQVRIDCFGCGAGWTRLIDDIPVFGSQTFEGTEWSLQTVLWGDIDDDTLLDVIVVANHSYYPSLLTVWNGRGERIVSYMNLGHIKQVAILPNDFYVSLFRDKSPVVPVPPPAGNGPALAMSVEVNESPRCAGLIVLPPGFTEGSYPVRDLESANRNHRRSTNLIFIRFMPSAVAMAFPAKQNWATAEISYDHGLRTIQVATLEEPGISPPAEGVIRVLDNTFRQFSVCPTDRFRNKYPILEPLKPLPALSDSTLQASFEQLRYFAIEGDIDVWAQGSWCR